MSGVAFFDLLTSHDRRQEAHCDVCVIGAGAAGIYLAVRLASLGFEVIVVEAGDVTCRDASAVGFDTKFSAAPYAGVATGRSFGIGGTTSLWGGLLIPHTRHDLRGQTKDGFDPWRHIVQTVTAKADRVLMNLGYEGTGEFSTFGKQQLGEVYNTLNASGLDVAASLFLPFRYRNLSFLLRKRVTKGERLRVFVNAVAKSWTIEPTGASGARVKGVTAISRTGNRLDVTAPCFVLTAGAIESARMLLEINRLGSCPAVRCSAAVGCYLADHLSLSIADVATPSLHQVTRLFSPRFSHGWMRSFRFMESKPPLIAPRAFAHFIFDETDPGFMLAKHVLAATQARRWPKVSPSMLVSGIGGLIGLAYARYLQSALFIAPGTRVHLQLDVEQTPVRENRISLGSEEDRYGRPIPEIWWRVSDSDMNNIHLTARRFLEKWPGEKKGLPALIPRNIHLESTKPHDVYHPVGICRMGADDEAVVDENLKVWGVTNLWVVSTGVLPSAGTANPTFTMLCLAEALADHLSGLAACL